MTAIDHLSAIGTAARMFRGCICILKVVIPGFLRTAYGANPYILFRSVCIDNGAVFSVSMSGKCIPAGIDSSAAIAAGALTVNHGMIVAVKNHFTAETTVFTLFRIILRLVVVFMVMIDISIIVR